MKKVLLLLLTVLMCGFVTAPLSAQDAPSVITVADGSSTNGYVPVYGLYLDVAQHNQIIYPESMLGDMVTGEISEMKFHLQNSVTTVLTSTITVSLGTTTTEIFTSGTLDDVTLTQVYTGAINISNQEFTITFSTPFTYNGGNLLFDITTTAANWATTTFYGISSTGSSYAYNSVRNFIPKTTFTYTGGALCKTPHGVTASDITTNSATISWNSDEHAGSYNIQYMPSSETDWANATLTASTDTFAYLTGLQPSSTYKVRVQIECDDNTQTVWSVPATFITGCDAITITADNPWFENFEGYTGGGAQSFVCWATPLTQVVDNGTSPFVYCGHAPACHSGANSAELKGANLMLVMPEFTNDIHELRLSFWATAVNPSNGTLEIGVLPDMDDLTSFELLGFAGTPSSRDGVGAYMGPFDFNGIQATSGRIAFRYTSSGPSNSWNLDDFTVELAPSCSSPVKTSVTATGVDGHNATISWVDHDETHTSWTVYYKAAGDDDYTPMTATDTFLVLTGLTPETTYSVYVVTNCGGVPAEDATILYTFTTLIACPAPASLTVSALASDEATITWVGTAPSYNVEYGEVGFDTLGTGTQDVVTDNSITLYGLTPNTSYTLNVNADCTDANDGLSSTSSITFTTTQVPVDLPYTADFSTAAEWKLNNGTCSNYWTVGTNGTVDALFVTNDGVTPGYSNSSSSTVTAEKLFTVGDAVELVIAFDLEVGGESSTYGYDYDYMKLLLAPATQDYPASTSNPSWATYGSTEYAYNFSNYLSSTGSDNGNNYKISKTNNLLHIEAIMPNPNTEPDASSTAKVVFVWRNDGSSGTQPGAVISNVNVSVLSCSAPTGIAASDITTTGATLSWNGDASEYSICLINNSDTTYYTATGTSFDFTDLTPSTQYTVYLRALCGSDSSILSAPYHFASGCDALLITEDNPWFENFEGYGTSGGAVSVGACWATPETQQVDNGLSPFVYCGHAGSTYSGVSSLEMKGGPTMVVFPEFSNDINTLRISMWGNTTASNASSAGNMVLGYISDITDPTTFVAVDTIPATAFNRTGTDAPHANFIGPYDLSGVTPQPGLRIALRLTDVTTSATGSSTSWNLDDITISLIPDCPSPVKTSVAITDVDGHNATVTFTDDDPNHDSWTVYYKASDDQDWTPELVSTTSVTLSGLDPETTYEVYVVTNCNGVASEDETNHKTFTTAVACPAPQNVTVSNIGMATATVTWTSNADSFSIEYGEAGFTPGAGTTVTTTATTYDLSGLTAGTSYTVYVTADCGAVDGTSSAASANFNTSVCDVEDQCVYTFNLADSYGDGWNGGTLDVIQNGITVATLGLSSGSSASVDVNLCHGVSTTLSWNAGSYAYEASFTLVGPDGAQLYASSMDNFPSDGYVFSPNCSACSMPAALTATNVTTSSATISWTGSADSYTVEYGISGFTPGTGTTATTTSTTYDLNGLVASTSYTVYVTADCGTEGTSSPASVSFMTPCETFVTFPYTEGFENGLGCWTATPAIGTVNWGISSSYNSSYTLPEGTSCVTASASNHNGNQAQLASPIFDLTSLTNPYLSFSHIQAVWAGDQDELYVYYKTSPSANAELLVSFTDNISSWQMDSVALPSPSSEYQIIFIAALDYGHGVGLDNVKVYDNGGSAPVVIEPTVVTNQASVITQNSATLNGEITNLGNQTITARGFEWKATNGGTYTQVSATGTTMTYNLTGLTAATSYTYRAFATTANMTTYGDEVTFTTTAQGQPTEPSATTADATNVTYNAATLNGSIANPDNVTITAQGFEWKATSAASYTTVNATGATMTYNLTGLDANTTYTYRAFVTTANGTHYGQDVTFTTEEEPVEPCDVPTGLMATDVQSESISITWDNAPALRWNLQYGPVGGTLASATATTNSYTFTNLTPLTTYQIQVQAVCEEGNMSEWSPAIEVTTTNLNSYLENNVTLYPNPAKEFVDVRVDGDVNVTGMEVYDVYGKVVRTIVGANNYSPLRINVSDLSAGMYFVRVTTEQGMVTKRFIRN